MADNAQPADVGATVPVRMPDGTVVAMPTHPTPEQYQKIADLQAHFNPPKELTDTLARDMADQEHETNAGPAPHVEAPTAEEIHTAQTQPDLYNPKWAENYLATGVKSGRLYEKALAVREADAQRELQQQANLIPQAAAPTVENSAKLNQPVQLATHIEDWQPTPEATPGTVIGSLIDSAGLEAYKIWNGMMLNHLDSKKVSDVTSAFPRSQQEIAADEQKTAELKSNIAEAENLQANSTPFFNNKTGETMYGVARGFTDYAPEMGAFMIDPALGATAMAGAAGFGGYGKYRARGATPEQAALGGTLEGSIMAATSALPMGYITKNIGKTGIEQFTGSMIERGIAPLTAQSVAMSAVDTGIANPDKTWGQWAGELPDTIKQAALSALIFTGAASTLHMGARGIKQGFGIADLNQTKIQQATAIDNITDPAKNVDQAIVAAQQELNKGPSVADQLRAIRPLGEDHGTTGLPGAVTEAPGGAGVGGADTEGSAANAVLGAEQSVSAGRIYANLRAGTGVAGAEQGAPEVQPVAGETARLQTISPVGQEARTAPENTLEQRQSQEERNRFDALYTSAVNLVAKNGSASVPLLQRNLVMPWGRAERIIQKMQDDGIVGEPNIAGQRPILQMPSWVTETAIPRPVIEKGTPIRGVQIARGEQNASEKPSTTAMGEQPSGEGSVGRTGTEGMERGKPGAEPAGTLPGEAAPSQAERTAGAGEQPGAREVSQLTPKQQALLDQEQAALRQGKGINAIPEQYALEEHPRATPDFSIGQVALERAKTAAVRADIAINRALGGEPEETLSARAEREKEVSPIARAGRAVLNAAIPGHTERALQATAERRRAAGLQFSIGQTEPITVDGIHRPALNSDGKPIHPTAEGTKNFWRWFGNSKIVDEQGRPQVMYHGTTANIEEFKPRQANAIFMTPDKETANEFTQRAGHENEPSGNVIPAYVKSEHPFDPDNKDDIEALRTAIGNKFPKYKGNEFSGSIDDVAAGRWMAIENPVVQRYIKANHDGFYVYEQGEKNLAVYDPAQIKSAIGNVGEFAPKRANIMQSVAPIFYSQLRKQIEAAPEKVFANGNMTSAWLEANSGRLGIKKDELYWTGIQDWLKAQGKTSKEDVLNFLDKNGVQVQEVELGGAPTQEGLAARKEIFDKYQPKIDEAYAEFLKENERHGATKERDAAYDKWMRLSDERDVEADSVYTLPADKGQDKTKFSTWQLPGGENYRELLLTLPTDTGKDQLRRMELAGIDRRRALTPEEQAEYDKLNSDKSLAARNFKSPHFEQPNILAHIRFNERTDAEGGRVLFIEELQSDWSAKGRKQGFAGEQLTPSEQAEYDRLIEEGRRNLPPEDASRLTALSDKRSAATGVPEAPFVGDTKSWTALAMKRMIRYAAENGFDKIAWTTGEQQAARYDLSKHVKEIDASPNGNGTYDLQLTMPDGSTQLMRNVEENALEDTIGKDLAKKIIDDSAKWLEAKKAYRDAVKQFGPDAPSETELDRLFNEKANAEERLTYFGLDLKVGGEGMKGYYDQIVPQVANDILKRAGGGKVDSVFMTKPPRPYKAKTIGGRDEWFIDTFEGTKSYSSKELADIASRTYASGKQPSFTITPELRAKVMEEGQPLFSRQTAEQQRTMSSPEEALATLPSGMRKAAQQMMERAKAGKSGGVVIGTEEQNMRRAAELLAAKHGTTVPHEWGILESAMRSGEAAGEKPIDLRERRDLFMKLPSDARQRLTEELSAAKRGGGHNVDAYQVDLDMLSDMLEDEGKNLKTYPAYHNFTFEGMPVTSEFTTKPKINGFYHPDIGTVFVNLDKVTPEEFKGVVAHEINHAANDDVLNREVMKRLEGATGDDIYGRVNARLERAGQSGNPREATSYLLEEAMNMGRTAGHSRLDQGFFGWAQKALPEFVVNTLKKWVAAVRAALYRSGIFIKANDLTVDDFVAINQASMKALARGELEPAQAEAAQPSVAGKPAEQAEQHIGKMSALMGKLKDTADAIADDFKMAVAPMAAGKTDAYRAIAKDYANAERIARWQWAKFDEVLKKNYTEEQLRQMWDAADEQNVLLQQGLPTAGKGLDRLTPAQRETMDVLHQYGESLLQRAKDTGMFKGEGLPYWTPRIAAVIGEDGEYMRPTTGAGGAKEGRNVTVSSPNLKQRKYLTAAETEAAMKAKFGETAQVVRNIRAMPLAMERLERAVAGRELINQIKQLGAKVGEDLVSTNAGNGYFTLDHPAFKTYRPRMIEVDGKMRPAEDQNGEMIFDKVPLYMRDDLKGPIKAILSQPGGKIYNALMSLKGRAMSVIMYSPLIHNAVEFGRALPIMPGKMLTFRMYFDGNKAKNDPVQMRQAIADGMVPIGHRGGFQDISGMMEGATIQAGRSLTAKAIGGGIGLLNKAAGEATKRGIDTFGDLWHNILLWDRVGDLQMGLYVNLKRLQTEKLIKQGLSQEAAEGTAGKIAAHMANRYAGALPNEAMSAMTRKLTNLALFSRSFTMGNLGVMKDIATGLPKDVQAQIVRDYGELALRTGKDIARRKALAAFVMDIGLMYAMTSLTQDAFDMLKRDKSLSAVEHGYADRLSTLLNKAEKNPLAVLNSPLDSLQSLSSTSANESGKEDRVLYGYDKSGTAIYIRLPTGKIGEEFIGWATSPLDMLKRKESTFLRPIDQTLHNDLGFGRRVYNPDDPGVAGAIRNVGKIVSNAMLQQVPNESIQAMIRGAQGTGTDMDAYKVLGPLFGLTFSRGAPGGPAVGEMFKASQERRAIIADNMPDIRQLILAGKQDQAVQKMIDIGMTQAEIKLTLTHVLNPAARLTPGALKRFEKTATDEQKEKMRQLQSH